MQEIDLKAIFALLLARLKWLVLGLAVGLLLFGSFAYLFVPEEYTASAMLYVRNTKEDYESNGTTTSNLQAAQQLVSNYTIHMKTKPVIDATVQKLDGAVTAGELRGGSSASSVDDTSWLKISVTLGDADLAVKACAALADASAETFGELETSYAMVREYPSQATQTAPNVARTAAIGGLLGIIVPIALILMKHFTDNTIRSKNDLQQRFDIPVLGEIPSFQMNSKKKRGSNYV